MLKFLLATIISLSASVREPRQVPTAPFDYEFSYQIENTYKGFEGSFKHDYEREDGEMFNDIKSSINYTQNLKLGNIHLPNHAIIVKEDYNQITSKEIYQFNSDIRFQFHGLSIGYGMTWDLEDKYLYHPSVGFTKQMTLGNWELDTENDVYFTKDITYQTEGTISYSITKNVGLGISGNYIKTLDNYDYSAQAVLTIKLTKD